MIMQVSIKYAQNQSMQVTSYGHKRWVTPARKACFALQGMELMSQYAAWLLGL